MNTTVAALRPVLADFFGRTEVDTALRTLRLAGLIPEGQSGHGGCRSARLDVRQVALVLIALSAHCQPCDSPAAAQRIAAFVWVGIDHTHISEPRRHEPGDGVLRFGDYLAEAIAEGRGGPPDYWPLGWNVGSFEASQRATSRMVFADPNPYSVGGVERITVLPGKLISDVGALFGAATADEQDAA